jgi:predicted RNA binding protein YcfA (HicA-like mRNA interferase family)
MSYNRRKVLSALGRRGVVVMGEGGRHTLVRSADGKRSSIPRHAELARGTVQGIVKQLGLDWEAVKKDIA